MSTTKRSRNTVVLALLLTGWVAWLLIGASRHGDMTAADEQAAALIERHHEKYRRWATPLWVAPGSEAENLLFALQAGVGGLVLGYAIGRWRRPPQ